VHSCYPLQQPRLRASEHGVEGRVGACDTSKDDFLHVIMSSLLLLCELGRLLAIEVLDHATKA